MELLSPVGSMKAVDAAIMAGADAIYGAGKNFGARAFANNFEVNEIKNICDRMHMLGRKFYLTLNTLIKQEEMKLVYDYVTEIQDFVDAVIVQDLGVLAMLSKYFPDLELHASTQMNMTGSDFASMLNMDKLTRIVLHREAKLEEIEYISKNSNKELEVFIHGAMCYSYSGRCLMSSLIGTRSANRGRCAQSCRMIYECGNEKSKLLSLKDLCAIDFLPFFKKNNVASLKIEGRMKSYEYVYGVTSIYRKYIDILEKKDVFSIDADDRRILEGLFNRDGFTSGYYELNKSMVSNKGGSSDSNIKKKIKTTMNFKDKIPLELKLIIEEYKLPRLSCKCYLGKDIINITIRGENIANPAINKALTCTDVEEIISSFGNTNYKLNKIKLIMGDNIFIPVKELKNLRRALCSQLDDKIKNLNKRDIGNIIAYNELSFKRENKKSFISLEIDDIDVLMEFINIYRYDNNLKRIIYNIKNKNIEDIEKDIFILRNKYKNLELILGLPDIILETNKSLLNDYINKIDVDGYLVRCVEELPMINADKKIITDFSIYAMNNESIELLKSMRVSCFTYPLELNRYELKKLSYDIESEMIIYGAIPVMLSRMNNITISSSKITDRMNASFNVIYNSLFEYTTIYNSDKLYLFNDGDVIRDISPNYLRLILLRDDAKNLYSIAEALRGLMNGDYYDGTLDKSFTRLHLNKKIK